MTKIKGERNGLCNRTACQTPHRVVWRHRLNEHYYCQPCAFRINDANMDFDGNPLLGVDVQADIEYHMKRYDEPREKAEGYVRECMKGRLIQKFQGMEIAYPSWVDSPPIGTILYDKEHTRKREEMKRDPTKFIAHIGMDYGSMESHTMALMATSMMREKMKPGAIVMSHTPPRGGKSLNEGMRRRLLEGRLTVTGLDGKIIAEEKDMPEDGESKLDYQARYKRVGDMILDKVTKKLIPVRTCPKDIKRALKIR